MISAERTMPGLSLAQRGRNGALIILERTYEILSSTVRLTGALLALHPVLEHLQRHGAVVLGRFRDRPIVAFLDPGLVRRGAVARNRQPHQATGALRRQPVAVEQHR